MVATFIVEPVAVSNSGCWLSHTPREINGTLLVSEEDISCRPLQDTELSMVIQSYEKTIGIVVLFNSSYFVC